MNEAIEEPKPEADKARDFKPADLNSRTFAAAIDMSLIMVLLWSPLMQISSLVNGPYDAQALAVAIANITNPATWQTTFVDSGVLKRYIFDTVLQVVTVGVLIVPFWVKVGATPGKYLLRMRVVNGKTGELLSWRHALIRYLCYASCMLTLGLGLLWIGLNKRCLALHDILASTRVVIIPKGTKFP